MLHPHYVPVSWLTRRCTEKTPHQKTYLLKLVGVRDCVRLRVRVWVRVQDPVRVRVRFGIRVRVRVRDRVRVRVEFRISWFLRVKKCYNNL